MSRDYKLNKSELTRLKRQEKLFLQYLPVLKLKQEQLQIEQNRIRKQIDEAKKQKDEKFLQLKPFVKCFANSSGVSIKDTVILEKINTMEKSVAGVKIQTLQSLNFKKIQVPFFQSAPWLLRSQQIIRLYMHAEVLVCYLEKEKDIIGHELRKATQKVNLFDMVLIPKTKAAIKRIKIALGDEQVASVSRGKIAKSKNNSQEIMELAL